MLTKCYIRIRRLFLAKDSFVNFSLLEFLYFLLIFGEVDWIFAELYDRFLVVCLKYWTLQEQPESRGLWNGNFLGPVTLVNALDIATRPHDEGNHSDHLSNLVHHEALTMDLEAQPFRSIDYERLI